MPEGAAAPVQAAVATGLAKSLDRALDRLRPEFELSTALYQRGRAAHFLLGRAGHQIARADFEAALRITPDHDAARIGLRATTLPGR
jgi:hypothetical protein